MNIIFVNKSTLFLEIYTVSLSTSSFSVINAYLIFFLLIILAGFKWQQFHEISPITFINFCKPWRLLKHSLEFFHGVIQCRQSMINSLKIEHSLYSAVTSRILTPIYLVAMNFVPISITCSIQSNSLPWSVQATNILHYFFRSKIFKITFEKCHLSWSSQCPSEPIFEHDSPFVVVENDARRWQGWVSITKEQYM